jgi:hypothetical protein
MGIKLYEDKLGQKWKVKGEPRKKAGKTVPTVRTTPLLHANRSVGPLCFVVNSACRERERERERERDVYVASWNAACV